MLRTSSVLFCLLIAFLPAWAQDTTEYVQHDTPKEKKDTRPLKDRIWFGGGLGLNFGNVTAIQLEPLVGYKVDRKGKFSVGTGLSYRYFSDNRYTPKYEYSAYGYRLFTRYRVIPQAYVHAEFLDLNAQPYLVIGDRSARIWIPHLLVGGGVSQPIGGQASFTMQVLWEVLQDPNSVYRGLGPVFSGGVGFGF